MASANAHANAIVIGASAGGVVALTGLLPVLAPDLAAAVIVVLHLPPERPSLLSAIFGRLCRLPVKEAEDKEPVEHGVIYFAPPDYHLLVDRGPQLVLSADPPIRWSRPAIDALFESAADVYRQRLTAIVLTGASDDGAAGAEAVARAGGRLLVQDPDDAVEATMPRAALQRVPDARIFALPALADLLRHWTPEP